MAKKEAKEQDKKKAKEPAKKSGRKEKALPAIIDTAPASPIEKATTPDIESLDPTPSELVPYDENLLERSRTQWQFGDWESLAKLERDTLQHHPDRAKLALLAAAGHQQLGNMAAARQFTRLAQDWGCGKKLVSQILIAGVHNTLGRAAASMGKRENSLKHFKLAVASGTPGGDIRLLVQARAEKQLEQLRLTCDANSTNANEQSPERLTTSNSQNHEPPEQLQKLHTELLELINKQSIDLLNVRKHLERTIKNETSNSTKQLEAFLGVQSYLNNCERVPSMHGWPISPDFALYLIELIDSNNYDLIIEFGSGTSTVLISKALARTAQRRQGKPATIQIAFEHLEQYHAQTLSQLQQANLAEKVRLVLAPLKPYLAPNGNTYMYYSCHETLAELTLEANPADLKILLIVDGPPSATGKHARYPAVPEILLHFKEANLDIVLDDYIRNDEKEVTQLWLQDIESLGLSPSLTEIKMEKDACQISICKTNIATTKSDYNS